MSFLLPLSFPFVYSQAVSKQRLRGFQFEERPFAAKTNFLGHNLGGGALVAPTDAETDCASVGPV